ncbi:MAG: zeta toxin family protein [Helicobacteraceae bacterium]|jgi:predicted ABC-type ATPase|nr:zeta toxin family protein [Helicobacteraceae bacterium]
MAGKPQLVVIAGPNGAGKSTLSAHSIFKSLPIINPDVITIENNCSPIEAGKIAIAQRRQLLQERQSFAIETTLTGNSEIALMRDAKKLGYRVNLAYVGISNVALSAIRVASRVAKGGHNIPKKDILRRYDRSLKNIPMAFEIADRAYIFDNSFKKRHLLYKKNLRIERIVAKDLPNWAKETIKTLRNIHREIDDGLAF